MDLYKPVFIPQRQNQPNDPRVGSLLGRDNTNIKLALLGFGSDTGVTLNGGRAGAAAAPAKIREFLYRFTPDAVHSEAMTRVLERTTDLGDLLLTGDLVEDQELLGREVSRLVTSGVVPIILGGGHETSYGHFLGYVGHKKQVEILNIDAHPDVRELTDNRGHSGSSFRQALEHPSRTCSRYTVAGLNPFSCASAHVDYLLDRGARYFWRDECTSNMVHTLLNDTPGITMVSLDMDAIEQSFAPGVSAPNPSGLHPEFVFEALYQAGKNRWVTSCDVVECNPETDHDDRTVRLAALAVWHFIRGFSQRYK